MMSQIILETSQMSHRLKWRNSEDEEIDDEKKWKSVLILLLINSYQIWIHEIMRLM